MTCLEHMMERFYFAVGWTDRRPIVVDEVTSYVVVDASTLSEAKMLAAQLVGCRAEMVTSTRLLLVEI